jgi:DNA polymerase III psi subunit
MISQGAIPYLLTDELYLLGYRLGIVSNPLQPQDEDLLQKILTAIGLLPAQVFICTELNPDIPCACWIVFQSNTNEGAYTLQEHQGTRIIYSDPLADLHNDVEKKRKLWSVIQSFKINRVA